MKTTVETFSKGPWNGFKVVMPEAESVQDAVEHYGEPIVLALINATLDTQYRSKIKNKLPTAGDEKAQKELVAAEAAKHPDGMLNSVEEALAWKPYERELSPEKQKQAIAVRALEIKEALAAGGLGKDAIALLNEEKATLRNRLLELAGLA